MRVPEWQEKRPFATPGMRRQSEIKSYRPTEGRLTGIEE
jgi:hypothetical protein